MMTATMTLQRLQSEALEVGKRYFIGSHNIDKLDVEKLVSILPDISAYPDSGDGLLQIAKNAYDSAARAAAGDEGFIWTDTGRDWGDGGYARRRGGWKR